jgi:hypothetical protein
MLEMSRKNVVRVVFFASLLILTIACRSSSIMDRTGIASVNRAPESSGYHLHRGIKTTYFYVGQKNRVKAGFLDNVSSAWTSDWVSAFGGVDSPARRRGYSPREFRPRENPFYCALPYNDVSFRGHKPRAVEVVPWAKRAERGANGEFASYCKNRWVRVTYKKRVCYAQWEDVGPFQTDDWKYVFGTSKPKNRRNGGVGLDLSPACFSYLGMKGSGHTTWQFVEFEDVPPGPWLRVITRSNPDW